MHLQNVINILDVYLDAHISASAVNIRSETILRYTLRPILLAETA